MIVRLSTNFLPITNWNGSADNTQPHILHLKVMVRIGFILDTRSTEYIRQALYISNAFRQHVIWDSIILWEAGRYPMMTSSNGNIFHVTGLFVRGIHHSPVNSQHKGQWRRALMFSWSTPEPTLEQTMETPMIWDAITLIMKSLLCKTLIFFFLLNITYYS